MFIFHFLTTFNCKICSRKFIREIHFNLSWKFLTFRMLCVKKPFNEQSQAEATRAEPDFVAPAKWFRSFLLSIWATLQTTPNDMKLEINRLECVHFYFLYLFCTSTWNGYGCLIVLDLEYFVFSGHWPLFFLASF